MCVEIDGLEVVGDGLEIDCLKGKTPSSDKTSIDMYILELGRW